MKKLFNSLNKCSPGDGLELSETSNKGNNKRHKVITISLIVILLALCQIVGVSPKIDKRI